MPDEYPPSIGVVSEQPPVPVSAAVNLSSPNGHATLLSRSHRYQCASSCLTSAARRGDIGVARPSY